MLRSLLKFFLTCGSFGCLEALSPTVTNFGLFGPCVCIHCLASFAILATCVHSNHCEHFWHLVSGCFGHWLPRCFAFSVVFGNFGIECFGHVGFCGCSTTLAHLPFRNFFVFGCCGLFPILSTSFVRNFFASLALFWAVVAA